MKDSDAEVPYFQRGTGTSDNKAQHSTNENGCSKRQRLTVTGIDEVRERKDKVLLDGSFT